MRIKPLLVLLPLLVSCVIFSSEEDVQGELDVNRAQWDAAAIHDYSMSFQRLCLFCSVEFLIPVRITVRGDTIYEMMDLDTGAPVEEPAAGAFLTIDGVFDVIQGAIDQGAAEIDVRYNSMFGYPTDVSIDLSRSLFNDDAQFLIGEFVELQ
jgi:hypothetical protein